MTSNEVMWAALPIEPVAQAEITDQQNKNKTETDIQREGEGESSPVPKTAHWAQHFMTNFV